MCTRVEYLRKQILEKAHGSRYSIRPGATKMYHDLREVYQWDGLKRDIAEFVAKCLNCQQVKAKHLKLGDLTQIMDVPISKWEAFDMDLLLGCLELVGEMILNELFWIG